MSNKTFNAKINNKAKKGISPVIATVILVAVAVVIAAALAGFSGSLFGSYSQGPQVKVKSFEVTGGPNMAGTVTLSNSGNQADTVSSIKIAGYTVANILNGAGDNVLPANTDGMAFAFTVAQDTATVDLVNGQQVSATIQMQSGASVTQTVTVS